MSEEKEVINQKEMTLSDCIALAGNGDADAQCKLGLYYKNGEELKKNFEKAFFWFEKSAMQGNADGLKNLADCYENGEGVKINTQKAYELYKESAIRGNVDALVNLIDDLYYSDDWSHKAVQYAKYGAQKGNAKAQYFLAYYYEKSNLLKNDVTQTFYWYSLSAKQGYAPAQAELGDCFANGKGTAVDLKKAFLWYKKSAINGNAYGEFKLAEFFEKGICIKKDLKTAELLYISSAKAENGRFTNSLIEFYERNLEELALDNSFHESLLHWVTSTAKKHFGCSSYLLGFLYEKGIIVEKNYKTALSWYAKTFGSFYEYTIKAQRRLAYLYFTGRGTEKNVQKGVETLNKLIKMYGSKDIEFELALLYQKGKYVEQDYEKASKTFEKLANKRHGLAAYCLSINYLKGYGVNKSIEKSNFWLTESAKLGCEKAKEKLKNKK